MNIVEGLSKYKKRKRYENNDIALLLGCSPSVVSQYLSGKSGLSLEKLSILLKDGMLLEEAFGEDVANAIKANMRIDKKDYGDSMSIVIEGLKKILDTIEK